MESMEAHMTTTPNNARPVTAWAISLTERAG